MGCLNTYTKHEWVLLVTLAAVTLGSSLCASLQAPFYPQEAEKKGAKATEYGLIFGIFQLTSFICCPLFGKYIGRLGAGRVLKAGTMVAGVSLILFGMLTYVEDRTWFITLSFLVRIVEGMGTSAVATSSLSIVVIMFSDTFARVFTMLEIFQGLGFMIGPSVGGYLFEIGGFVCPFAAVGTFVIFNGLLIVLVLPKIEETENKLKRSTSILTVLKVVPILLDSYCMIVEAVTLGFLVATLEPHLRQFNLTPTAIGGIFALSCLIYTLVAPLVGFLCDKKWDPKKMILLGSVINITFYMLIGPIPFTPFVATVWLVIVGQILSGIGSSLMYVPAFVDAISSAVIYGLPDDITTYALVSGIYASAFSLGAFIGPSVAGVLYDLVGFRPATLFVISMHLLLIIAMSWFLCVEKSYDARNINLMLSLPDDDVTRAGKNNDAVTVSLMETPKESHPISSDTVTRRHHQYNSIGDQCRLSTEYGTT